MYKKIKVGILGATGMVGQRLIMLLNNHPYFEIKILVASPISAGKKYYEAVKNKWVMEGKIPKSVSNIKVLSLDNNFKEITNNIKLIFSAFDLEKEKIKAIEEKLAQSDIVVVSNNSAHRWTEDIPMILPEINPSHLKLIDTQRKKRSWKKGLIVVKPNCSIQSYVPLITPLFKFKPSKVVVTTLQSVSGAGKTLDTWPEMKDNVIPYIPSEEDKSEKEPLRIWGKVSDQQILLNNSISISATCIRVPVSNGHLASVALSFKRKPTKEEITACWRNFNPLENLNLPSAPKPFITYFEELDRPQVSLDRNLGNGMGISAGRLKEDEILDYKFIGLSHNTIRGAAGGSVLTAELLLNKGYIT